MFGGLQELVLLVISIAAFAGAVYGLIDAAHYPDTQFVAAGKRSKTLWLVILGLAAVFTIPAPLGGVIGLASIFGLASIVAVIIYFVDVRPALGPRRPGSSRGSSGGARGGW
ncbi:DUF2516 family protein [Demequina iriomotensis]|uniref:DUF2516 family protein n=1 Tax=Demequina iriomotensis TaxID=1536641 RepID=UPI0007844C46|nr:DUF2516 family protein [Demequina iriomotensis]